MYGPGENNGVGLQRKRRRLIWFFRIKAESISIWPDTMGGKKGAARGRSHAAEHPEIHSHLSSIRLDGEMAFTSFPGGTTAVRFLTYLKEPPFHIGVFRSIMQ